MPPKLYGTGDSQRIVPSRTESGQPYRSDWRRDYGRIIHSPAFRRLQGKTQLFPSHESDFFRNRLTHSLEVAQIAKSIAIKLNETEHFFTGPMSGPIDLDLVELAALSHDLGHPPFGHNGEIALDRCMRDHGGFEGNGQTLRILSKIEKKQTRVLENSVPLTHKSGKDERAGLNMTYRSLAAVLKYDREIPRLFSDRSEGDGNDPIKGYYGTEAGLVAAIKSHVGTTPDQPFKTLECYIMDIADDIAYSTYDLEDAFKGRFLTPLSMISVKRAVIKRVADKVSGRLKKAYPNAPHKETDFTVEDTFRELVNVFRKIFDTAPIKDKLGGKAAFEGDFMSVVMSQRAMVASNQTAENAYFRSQFTSELVNEFIKGVVLEPCYTLPALSKVRLNLPTLKCVETLKNFTYEAIIMSSMLKVAEHRGQDIVRQIFEALVKPAGNYLMPDDCRDLHDALKGSGDGPRIICDFIAGMTDRYAIQFYGRLFGTNPESIYSPL